MPRRTKLRSGPAPEGAGQGTAGYKLGAKVEWLTLKGHSGASEIRSTKAVGRVIRFGPARLETGPADPDVQARGVSASQAAARGLRQAFAKPGVRLGFPSHVPQFRADPKDPKRVLRILNGVTEAGVFENGVFKAVE